MRKGGIFVIVLVIAIFGIYAYQNNLGGFKTTINTVKSSVTSNVISNSQNNYISIKDLSQNPSSYVGKSITIRGELIEGLGGYGLKDSDSYWVWIGNDMIGGSCIERQRGYNYYSQIYTAEGVWASPSYSGLDKYHLSCNSPLE